MHLRLSMCHLAQCETTKCISCSCSIGHSTPGPNPTLVGSPCSVMMSRTGRRDCSTLPRTRTTTLTVMSIEGSRISRKIFMFPLGGEAGVQGDSPRLPTPTPLVRSGGSALLQCEMPYLNLGWASPGSNDLTENLTPWSQRGGRAGARKRHWNCPCSPEAYSGTNFFSGIANHYRLSCPPPET